MEGRNVIVQAQLGAGKTTALAISALQSIDTSRWGTQALVLCPTEQSAADVRSTIIALGTNMGAECFSCVSGTPVRVDLLQLATNRAQDVVTGTPDQVLDLIRGGILRTDKVKMFVLEDADRLVNGGFGDQILEVYRSLVASTQTLVSSTTLSETLLETTANFMIDPIRITLERDAYIPIPEGIKHFFIHVNENQLNIVRQLFSLLKVWQAIVFCNPEQASILLCDQKLGLISSSRLIPSDAV
jgi:superfamily II DNA/RNA helicase